MDKRLKVGVLMGGKSIEREVSFNSGRTVCDHLDTTIYNVIPLFQTTDNRLFILPWRFLHRGKITDFEHRLATQAQEITWDDLKNHIDFIYIAVHGRYAEDGTLQGFLEVLNIPYLGTKILGSALGMDKAIQKKFLKAAHIAVPNDYVVSPQQLSVLKNNSAQLETLLKMHNLTFPVVVKPSQEGSSLGISVAFDTQQLVAALEKAATAHPTKQQSVLIEEKIEGMEFTCIILIDPVTQTPTFFPPTEIVHEKGTYLHDYQQKYMPGRSLKFTPARCSQTETKRIQSTCLQVMKALNFTTMGRIDGFLKPDGSIVIIDPNTLCGMAPSSFFFNQAAQMNMSHTDIINHLIKAELTGYGIAKDLFMNHTDTSAETKKIKVAVLLGGPSNEKEVSLDSGRNVCYKLSPHKYEVLPVFVDKKTELYPLTHKLLVHNATAEIEHDLDRSTRINWHDLPKLVDFVFIALHGGPGENGAIQGALEMLGIPYNGSGVAATALCLDKYKTELFLKAQGFDVPLSQLVSLEDYTQNKASVLQNLADTLPFPLIVKPHDDGCSVLVQKIYSQEDLSTAIEAVFAIGKTHALVEEFIVGMELTVGVIGNDNPQALPPSQAVTTSDILSMEEKFLPGAGENQTPAPLPKEALALVQRTMEGVFKALDCSGYVRIDCFYQASTCSPTKKERVIILEINSLPALTPATCLFHQAAEVGIKPMDFIDLIVALGFEKHTSIPVLSQNSFIENFIKNSKKDLLSTF